MHEYCIEMTNLSAKLKNLGMSVEDSFLVHCSLNSPTSQYEPFQINCNITYVRWMLNDLANKWFNRRLGLAVKVLMLSIMFKELDLSKS